MAKLAENITTEPEAEPKLAEATGFVGKNDGMVSTNCECCMMPLTKDTGQRTSEQYCSFCYQNGRLNAEGASLQEFQRRCFDGMRGRGMNFLIAWFFSFLIRFAPYWKARKARK
ncbi:MAG: zinc ribbon domain-containing protein [Rhodospirillaceae bacterium]